MFFRDSNLKGWFACLQLLTFHKGHRLQQDEIKVKILSEKKAEFPFTHWRFFFLWWRSFRSEKQGSKPPGYLMYLSLCLCIAAEGNWDFIIKRAVARLIKAAKLNLILTGGHTESKKKKVLKSSVVCWNCWAFFPVFAGMLLIVCSEDASIVRVRNSTTEDQSGRQLLFSLRCINLRNISPSKRIRTFTKPQWQRRSYH